MLLYHSWLYGSPNGRHGGRLMHLVVPNLALGVTLFFTLSGFLLWRPFAAALLDGRPRPRLLPYLRNRALRILPAYWVVLLVCALVLDAVLVRRSPSEVALGGLHDPLSLLDVGGFAANLSPATLENGLGPAWTLAVEVQFYLVLLGLAGLAFAAARRHPGRAGRRGAALAPGLTLLAIGLAGKLATTLVKAPGGLTAHRIGSTGTFAYPADWHTVLQLSLLGQADLFAFGALLAVVQVEVQAGRLRLPARWRRFTVATGVVLGVGALLAVRGQQLAADPANTAVAAAMALMLAPLVITPRSDDRVLRVLESPAVVAIGLASYSVFLWNDSVERLLFRHGLTVSGAAAWPVNAAALAIVVGALATLTYRLVERPALALKARPREVPPNVIVEPLPR